MCAKNVEKVSLKTSSRLLDECSSSEHCKSRDLVSVVAATAATIAVVVVDSSPVNTFNKRESASPSKSDTISNNDNYSCSDLNCDLEMNNEQNSDDNIEDIDRSETEDEREKDTKYGGVNEISNKTTAIKSMQPKNYQNESVQQFSQPSVNVNAKFPIASSENSEEASFIKRTEERRR